jgi:hypothetical protein
MENESTYNTTSILVVVAAALLLVTFGYSVKDVL